ncbi:hypothetical protein ACFX13_036556 [Malus domestica]
MGRIKDDPKIKKTTLQLEIYRDLGYEVSTDQCYKAKRKAITLIEGTYAQQYEKLWEYCKEVRKTNIASTMMMKVDPPYFQRLYVCLDACKQGFVSGCRPLIGVDGCHLKGTFQGQLLVAVGIDANDNMYPIAYAVAELETKESWCWFLQLLIEDLGPGQALKDKLWSAAMASNEVDFNCEMEKLKELDEEAYKWLKKRDPNMWARHRFSLKIKCDMLLNNLCECFNSWILAARDKPILTMLEMIKCKIMRRLQVKRDLISKFEGPVCPKIQGKLEKNKTLSRRFKPVYCDSGVFQVGDSLVDQHSVNLWTKTCSCKRWVLNGIPCMHVISAIFHNRQQGEEYVDEYYTPYAYLRAYSPVIYPVKGMKYWPKVKQTPVLPSMVKKQPGRLKKRRIIRDPEIEKNKDPTKLDKKGSSKTCTKCWEKGHNRVGCKNQPREAPRGVYIDKRWAYQFHQDGSHGRGVNNNEGNEETHPTPPYQCSNVQQSGEVFVPQRNVTGESSRHNLNKKYARPSNLQVRNNRLDLLLFKLETSQPKYFNPANVSYPITFLASFS